MTEGEWHKKVRKRIKKEYEDRGYTVKFSHDDKTIVLSIGEAHLDTVLSEPDVVILKDDVIKKIIEIKYNDIQPKIMAGTVVITNICNQCKIDDESYELSNVFLSIVYKKPVEGSKKQEQLELIKKNLKVDGCLRDFDFKEIVLNDQT